MWEHRAYDGASTCTIPHASAASRLPNEIELRHEIFRARLAIAFVLGVQFVPEHFRSVVVGRCVEDEDDPWSLAAHSPIQNESIEHVAKYE